MVSEPVVKGTRKLVSCGFAALTLDHRSSDQVRAGYREAELWSTSPARNSRSVWALGTWWPVGVAERVVHSRGGFRGDVLSTPTMALSNQGPAQAPAGGACPPYGPGRAAKR